MTYALLEFSSSEGRPYFLYQFVEGDQVWRFTSRADAWTSPTTDGETLTWDPAAVAHGDVVQTSEIERGRLELTWPLSHPFARRFLAPMGTTPVTLTIFRGHEQVPGETVAHWKGRVVGAEVEGQRILLQAESLFSTLHRAGVRAKYQRLCRHAHYGRGCALDIAAFTPNAGPGNSAGHPGHGPGNRRPAARPRRPRSGLRPARGHLCPEVRQPRKLRGLPRDPRPQPAGWRLHRLTRLGQPTRR